MRYSRNICAALLATASLIPHAEAFETAKVLPPNVRNVRILSATAKLSEKTDSNGGREALASPFAKGVDFASIVKRESGVDKMLLQAFLEDKYTKDDVIGSLTADVKGRVSVTVPVLSYGLTDRLTVALAVPYYNAQMRARLGFKKSANFDGLMTHLSNAGQTEKANEVRSKFRNIRDTFNDKLNANGYEPLTDWQGQGIGDVVLAAKYLVYHSELIRWATSFGTTLPTGKTKDPDLLLDIPFGNGSVGVFVQSAIDECFSSEVFVNQYLKYRVHSPTTKSVRLKTADESLEVPKGRLRYRRGDEWELGASLNYEASYGLLAGAGLAHTTKGKDRFSGSGPVQKKLQENTNESASYWEAKLGYSTLPAFKRRDVGVPLNIAVAMKRHVFGKNSVRKNLFNVDVNLFF